MPKTHSLGEMLWRYLRPHWLKAVGLAAFMLTTIGLSLVRPQIVRGFIDAAQAQTSLEQLGYAAATYLGIGISIQALTLATTWLSASLGFGATNAIRNDLADHCLRLNMAFHNDRTPGEMIERIDGDVTALANLFSVFLVRLLGSALLIIGTLTMLYREDWRVGAGLSVFVAIALAVLFALRKVAVGESEAERQASAEMFGFLEERIAGLDDIRANGINAYTMRRFGQRLGAYYQTGRRAFKKRTIVWRTTMLLFGQGQVMVLAVGAYLFMQGRVTIGTVYLLYHYTNMLFDPIEQVAQQIQDLQKALASLGRVRELMREDTFVHDEGANVLPEGALPLAFDDIRFGYEDDDAVLRGLSFQLEPGTKLGLLGRTGSGKTTLTRLLFRLYEPDAGRIRLADQKLGDLSLANLRQRVAMVTQEVQIFRASVRDNLTFFEPDVDDQVIIDTLYSLGMGDWFERLPEGLDTQLVSGNEGLSAGEAQLLAFGRAFLGDPGLVILDEPSSRLDPATEHLLEQAMNRLLEGRTAIIIAHRLATVRRVDKIMIMGHGEIEEFGDRGALAADRGSLFHHLLTTGLEEAIA